MLFKLWRFCGCAGQRRVPAVHVLWLAASCTTCVVAAACRQRRAAGATAACDPLHPADRLPHSASAAFAAAGLHVGSDVVALPSRVAHACAVTCSAVALDTGGMSQMRAAVSYCSGGASVTASCACRHRAAAKYRRARVHRPRAAPLPHRQAILRHRRRPVRRHVGGAGRPPRPHYVGLPHQQRRCASLHTTGGVRCGVAG